MFSKLGNLSVRSMTVIQKDRHRVNQSINQSISQLVNQSINQSININQSSIICQSLSQPTIHIGIMHYKVQTANHHY